MSNVGGQAGYPYGPPPGRRPPSAWIWPVVMGVGMVVAAVLVLLVALQLTEGDDGSLGTADTSSTSSTTTTPAPPSTVSPTTTAADTTSVVSTAPPPAPTLAPGTSVLAPPPPPTPTVAAPPTAVAAPPPSPSEQTNITTGPSCSDYTPDESIPVRRCTRGALVEEIQVALRSVGFSVDADGFFGPGTERAVIDFQASRGLEQDGIVGPATYDALTG